MANDMSPRNVDIGKKTAGDFSSAAEDVDADIHDETAEEFEAKLAEYGGDPEAVLAAEDADEVIENAREREQERRDEVTDAQREEDEKKAGFSDKFKDASNANPTEDMSYTGSRLKDYVSYGMNDKGAYYNFNNHKVSDKQLRRMILRGHLDKGWNTLYFYDKKGRIDEQLTARAQNIVNSFKGSKNPKLAAIGQAVDVSSRRMTELEPFLKGNPGELLAKQMEKITMKWNAEKAEWKNSGLPIPILNSDKRGGAAALINR